MAATDYLLPNLATGTFPSTTVTPLIDGEAFNSAVQSELNDIALAPISQKRFVYIANWWLGLAAGKYTPTTIAKQNTDGPTVEDTPLYFLDGPLGQVPLLTLLQGLALRGVDVRVMGFVGMVIDGRFILKEQIADQIELPAQTVNAITLLRSSAVGNGAIMNVLAHPAGSVHLKMVVLRNGDKFTAYTGGIDFAPDRWTPSYPADDHPKNYFWHDAMVRVEGRGVQPVYECFRLTYNENLDSKRERFVFFEGKQVRSFAPGTQPIAAWADLGVNLPNLGTQIAQSLRTVPIFNYAKQSEALVKTASFAGNGLFEIRDAWKNAIDHATKYIYMEDQFFWSEEVLGWVAQAISRGVKAILVTSGGSDPRDPQFSPSFLGNGLSSGLFQRQTPTTDTLNSVKMFTRWGAVVDVLDPPVTITSATPSGANFVLVTSSNAIAFVPANALAVTRAWIEINNFKYPVIAHDSFRAGNTIIVTVRVPSGSPNPATGGAALKRARPLVVHSKITIVDDVWAIVQSGNCTRRSLYSDFEHGVAFIDATGTSVRDLRASLWAEAFNGSLISDFNNLDIALNGWNSSWGVSGGITIPKRDPTGIVPDVLEPVDLLVASSFQMTARDKVQYDAYSDLDTRQPWRLLL